MKKKIVLVLLAALLCAGLFISCGDDPEPTPTPTPEVEKFKVLFDPNSDDTTITGMPATQEVAKGGKATKPTDPVRNGFELTGWYTDKYEEDEWVFDTNTVTKAITLYAGWSRVIQGNLGRINVVNSDKQKGWATNGTDDKETDLDVVTLINAQSLKLVLEAKPAGGIQLIWQGDGDGWAWNQTDVATGAFVLDTTKATWDDATSTLLIDLPATLDNYTALAESYKVKLIVAYYSPDFDGLGIVSADLVAKAEADQIKFVFITFDSDGGNFGTVAKPEATRVIRVVKGGTIASFLPDPLKDGYNLTGWKDSTGATVSEGVALDGDATYTAVWASGNPAIRTVSFDSNGGSDVDDVEVINNQLIGAKIPANPTREGYVFDGWFDGDDNKLTAKTPITADITFSAKWKVGWINGKAELKIADASAWAANGNSLWSIDDFIDEFAANKPAYLVIEIGANSNVYLGGANFVIQDKKDWGWNDKKFGGDADTSGSHHYIVIDLKSLTDGFAALLASKVEGCLVGIQHYGGTMLLEDTVTAFITTKDLSTNTSKVDIIAGVSFYIVAADIW